MRLTQLIKDLKYRRLESTGDCEIKGISCNSSRITPGYLFIAVRGEDYDGHNFLNQAIDRGASAVIMQEGFSLAGDVAKIWVDDSRLALACVSAAFFGHPSGKLKTVGITGTNGKTTVSYLIESILASAGRVCGVSGTVNYRIGSKIYNALASVGNTTPRADILQSFLQEIVLAESKYAIIEVSSHALAQKRVNCVDFDSAVFTNLSQDHLDYHADMQDYFSCKAGLFKGLRSPAWAIINMDDAWGRQLLKQSGCRVITFGIESSAMVRAKNLNLGIEETRFTVLTPQGDDIEVSSPLIGKHNVYNILAAAAWAFVGKIDFSDVISGIKNCVGVPGRLERVDCGQDFLTFVDYAHTPDALERVLSTLKEISGKRIILVFGCGGNRDREKRPKMGRVAASLADFTVITCDNPRKEEPQQIISDIVRGIDEKAGEYKVVLNRFQAIEEAFAQARAGDIVLIAGKGHECSQIFADRTVCFNDRKAAENILRKCSQSKKY